jgi:hypothetical protein
LGIFNTEQAPVDGHQFRAELPSHQCLGSYRLNLHRDIVLQ